MKLLILRLLKKNPSLGCRLFACWYNVQIAQRHICLRISLNDLHYDPPDTVAYLAYRPNML